jgi:hypothetical protein
MTTIPVPARRPAAGPHDPMVTAIHEAGHAVVALALGHEVTRLSLEFCRTRYRRNDEIAWWNEAVISMAGAAAEQRLMHYPEDVLAMMRRSAWATDRRCAEHWLRLIPGVTLANTEAMAAHLVAKHWPRIVRVARALTEERETSGVTLDRLWRE